MYLTQEDVKTMQNLLDSGWSRIGINDSCDISGQADMDFGLLGIVTISYLPAESSVLVWEKESGKRVVSFAGCGYFTDIVKQAKFALREALQRQIEQLIE